MSSLWRFYAMERQRRLDHFTMYHGLTFTVGGGATMVFNACNGFH